MIITGDDSEYIAFVKAHLSERSLALILVLFVTFLGLRFPPPLMPFLFPKKSISRIFFLVRLSVMSASLRLLWSLMFTFALQMV